MDRESLNILFRKLLDNNLSEEEKSVLQEYVNDQGNREEFIQLLGQLSDADGQSVRYDETKWDPVIERVTNLDKPVLRPLRAARPKQTKPLIYNNWLKYAAAVIILSACAYLYTINTKEKRRTVSAEARSAKEDVAPGSDRAILTLSSGQKVQLKPGARETLLDGKLPIENADGSLHYSSSGDAVFNTMSTPNGGQYSLVLADGTRAWLNAASSITYPTAFTGNSRTVRISGEVYFEVAKNSRPFVVYTPVDSVTVLGTRFNIHAYADEAVRKTSLLEGAVRVGQHILKPGQAFLNGKVIQTNLEQDIAWKNGYFNFEAMNLEEVMRQLSRWYDIEVVFETKPSDEKFRGELLRSLTLRQVLSILEKMEIKYELKGKTLIIK